MKVNMKKALKIWTYTIRTQWSTFTVLICIKWEWCVLSLAWNIWVAESDKKQFNTWVQIVLNDHSRETGECLAVCENCCTEWANDQLRQNSRLCSSATKDVAFSYDHGIRDVHLGTLSLRLNSFLKLSLLLSVPHTLLNHLPWRTVSILGLQQILLFPDFWLFSGWKNISELLFPEQLWVLDHEFGPFVWELELKPSQKLLSR